MSPSAAGATAWATFAVTLVVYAVVFGLAVPTRNLSNQSSSGWSSGGGALWI